MPQVNGNWNGMPAWSTTGWTPQGPIEQRLSMVPTYPNTFGYTAGPNPFCQCNNGCYPGNL